MPMNQAVELHRTYGNNRAFTKDRDDMAGRGWHVLGTRARLRRPGLLAKLFRRGPASSVDATYGRTTWPGTDER